VVQNSITKQSGAALKITKWRKKIQSGAK